MKQEITPSSDALAQHGQLFVDLVLKNYGLGAMSDALAASDIVAHALDPEVIDDYQNLTDLNKHNLAKAYTSSRGVAYFLVRNPQTRPERSHPVFDIASQLAGRIPLAFPLKHPMEGHPEAVARFGPPDETVKIYDLPGRGGVAGYREQAETSELFNMHHDGLGSGGTVQTVVLYMDSPPLFGGYTYFQNIPLLALRLAIDDPEAFRSLFLPNAITIIRPRGKGAIKVTTPVLFVNDSSRPQSFFRVASGEYEVHWRNDAALTRARGFLEAYVPPFSRGTSCVHFTAAGHGCLIDNQFVAHARTSFVDDEQRGLRRVLSRKWFMRTSRDGRYKHIPGMFVDRRFASDYSSVSNSALLEGEWLYDRDRDVNERIP